MPSPFPPGMQLPGAMTPRVSSWSAPTPAARSLDLNRATLGRRAQAATQKFRESISRHADPRESLRDSSILAMIGSR